MGEQLLFIVSDQIFIVSAWEEIEQFYKVGIKGGLKQEIISEGIRITPLYSTQQISIQQ